MIGTRLVEISEAVDGHLLTKGGIESGLCKFYNQTNFIQFQTKVARGAGARGNSPLCAHNA
jgi:hypothetical protein